MPAQEVRSSPAASCPGSGPVLGVRLLPVQAGRHIMNNRWRTVDIVIASIIAVAFGVIFGAWGLLWNGPADAIPLPGRAVIYGMWLVPAVLGGLIVRKPGAAFYTLT